MSDIHEFRVGGLNPQLAPISSTSEARYADSVNTVLLGGMLASYSLVSPGVPTAVLLAMTLTQGFFSSLQFTCMNSLVYADVPDEAASRAGSIASTAQQLSLSFGVATGSMLAAWFVGAQMHPPPEVLVPALHRAYLVVGVLTALSSFTFWGLKSNDGDNVSNRRAREMGRMQDPPANAG